MAAPGWWQASDGGWYPPEQHPNYRPPMPPLLVVPRPKHTGRNVLLGVACTLGLLVVVGMMIPPGPDSPAERRANAYEACIQTLDNDSTLWPSADSVRVTVTGPLPKGPGAPADSFEVTGPVPYRNLGSFRCVVHNNVGARTWQVLDLWIDGYQVL